MSNEHDPDYYDEDGDLADHIQSRIWDEGSEASENSWGFAGRTNAKCPYAEGSMEYDAWWGGFNQTFFRNNH